MPTGQSPTSDDADIISKAFATVCMVKEKEVKGRGSQTFIENLLSATEAQLKPNLGISTST